MSQIIKKFKVLNELKEKLFEFNSNNREKKFVTLADLRKHMIKVHKIV
jgi:hypothetical protein